jgi:Uncharacterized protein conserved in bacteria
VPHNRFYSETTIITDAEHHHLVHVMRNREGDTIELVNGKGSLMLAKIETLTRREAHVSILETKTSPPPSIDKDSCPRPSLFTDETQIDFRKRNGARYRLFSFLWG